MEVGVTKIDEIKISKDSLKKHYISELMKETGSKTWFIMSLDKIN